MPPRQNAEEIKAIVTEPLLPLYPHTGELAVRGPEPQKIEERVVSRDSLQLETLALFGQINQKEAFIRNKRMLARYGNGAPIVEERVKDQLNSLRQRAHDAFFDSLEYDQGIAQLIAEKRSKRDVSAFELAAKRQWNRFQLDFHSPANRLARERKSRELRREIKMAHSTDNRNHQFRPHMLDEFRKKLDLPRLSSRERMVAIAEDPRASFIPATNREKTMIMSWLDYLDNPGYPLGVANQLLEIFNHQSRLEDKGQYGARLPTKTVESNLFQIHDYGVNAARSLRALQQLDSTLNEFVNLHVSLGEEVVGHPGLAPLVRYRDLKNFVDKNILPKHGVDPLLVREDRRPHYDPEKNKTVEDIYTRLEFDEHGITGYIINETFDWKIKDALPVLKQAIMSEEKRLNFWRDRLHELSEVPDSKYNRIRRRAVQLLVKGMITPVGAGE